MVDGSSRLPPSAAEIEQIGRSTLKALPDMFRKHLHGVVVKVEEFPDEETLDAMEIDDPYDLMGLYAGVPVGDVHGAGPRHATDMIFLYRRPMLDYWCEHEIDFIAVVRHVLIHEIGHHFGLSDDDMERIEAMADLEDGTDPRRRLP